MKSEQTPESIFSEKPKNAWNTVTPLSKYLALALFTTLPFLGGYIGYEYGPKKVVEVERIVIKEIEPVSENIEISSVNNPDTEYVLSSYLSRYPTEESFYVSYSSLSDDEFSQINDAIELASQNIPYTKQQIEAIDNLYRELFIQRIGERIQDAPSMRANELIGAKLCVAKAVITHSRSTVVDDCTGGDNYPTDIEWSTDDITAEAQIAPFYTQGSYFFEQAKDKDLAVYYLNQVVRHHEIAKEQWGEEYFENTAGKDGKDYVNMVEDANKKLDSINSQPSTEHP